MKTASRPKRKDLKTIETKVSNFKAPYYAGELWNCGFILGRMVFEGHRQQHKMKTKDN